MATACIQEHNGAPTIFVNDQLVTGLDFRSSISDLRQCSVFTSAEKELHAAFGAQGIHIHTLPTTPSHMRFWQESEGWIAPDAYRYEEMDRSLSGVLEAERPGSRPDSSTGITGRSSSPVHQRS